MCPLLCGSDIVWYNLSTFLRDVFSILLTKEQNPVEVKSLPQAHTALTRQHGICLLQSLLFCTCCSVSTFYVQGAMTGVAGETSGVDKVWLSE